MFAVREGVCVKFCRMKETYGIPVNAAEKDLGLFCGREDCDRYKVLVFRAAAEGAIPCGEAAALLNQNLRVFRMESEFL